VSLKVPVMPRTESYGTFSPAPLIVRPTPTPSAVAVSASPTPSS
jgi:hypothetical protein